MLYRGEHCFVVLNKYPYNNGHLLVAPYAHAAQLDELSEADHQELAGEVRSTPPTP